jgi:hypothetical protein
MGTTPNAAIPYVEPTDALANYPVQDKAQADRIDTLLQSASASYLRTGAVTIPGATQTTVLLDTAIRPLEAITYNAGTGTFTLPVAGRYLFLGNLTWKGTDTGGYRQIRLLKAGALTDLREQVGPQLAGADEYQSIARVISVAANDTFALAAFSSMATSLVVNASRTYVALELYRLGP